MLMYGKYESCRYCMFSSCGSSKCGILHDLQFLNAGRGCKRRPYGRAGFMTALLVAISVSFCLPHPVAVSVIFNGLCACTEML